MPVFATALFLLTSSQMPGQMPGGMGGGGAPSSMHEDHRAAPPPPSTPELRKLEGIRARFEFARENKNTGSIEVLDGELLNALKDMEPLKAAGSEPAVESPSEKPAEKKPPQPLTTRVLAVKGKYDEASLNVRRNVLNALLSKAMADAASLEPPRSTEPVEEAPRQRGGGHHGRH